MIVGSKEVQRREVKGTFRRFHYTNNGFICYVYCRSVKDFYTLFVNWQSLGRLPHYNMDYQIPGPSFEGHPIALEDIPLDQRFKVKVLLYQYGVEYIQ